MMEEPEFYVVRKPRASKSYRCCECHNEITKGEQYEYVFGRWGGSVGHYRTCLICAGIRDDQHFDEVAFGELAEAIREELGTTLDSLRDMRKAMITEVVNDG